MLKDRIYLQYLRVLEGIRRYQCNAHSCCTQLSMMALQILKNFYNKHANVINKNLFNLVHSESIVCALKS